MRYYEQGDASISAVIPPTKPDYLLSPADKRMYDHWNPYEDRSNEPYSNSLNIRDCKYDLNWKPEILVVIHPRF